MALLNTMMRHAAITGRTDELHAYLAGRQRGRWAEWTMRAPFTPARPQARRTPPAVATRPPADPAETLRQLTELHRRGVVTDAEFETLRAGLRV
jgi:hypothetical protein